MVVGGGYDEVHSLDVTDFRDLQSDAFQNRLDSLSRYLAAEEFIITVGPVDILSYLIFDFLA